MKRGKNQAIYSYLPNMWVSDKSSDDKNITGKITAWNHVKMDNIYEQFIESEIKHQIKLFSNKGGEISSFNLDDNRRTFSIVEPACNDSVQDITGEISPLAFYCSGCNKVFELKTSKEVNNSVWKCKNCGKQTVKQLQMIYSCECGYAEPITIPFVPGVNKNEMLYKPNDNAYKMIYKTGKNIKFAEFQKKCPNCEQWLRPDNAESNRNFKPFTLRTVNLVDKKHGDFFEKGEDAQKVVVAEWLGKLTREQYHEILSNLDTAFSENTTSEAKMNEIRNQVRSLVELGLVSEEKKEETIRAMIANANPSNNVDKYVTAIDNFFISKKTSDPIGYLKWIKNYSFSIMQYNAIKYAPKVITLQESINNQKNMDFIESDEEIYKINQVLGIKNVQLCDDIEIINCTYGYTRKITNPEQAKKYLKLSSFLKDKKDGRELVYSSKLKTEGLLFEIDRVKIINWLLKNNIIGEEIVPDLDDENEVKKWFIENIRTDMLNSFAAVEITEKITKSVFSLLHSISHAFIRTCGELSGLASNSLTELIFMDTTSIFIYSQTSQGLVLGSLASMFESNYYSFIHKTLQDNKDCFYDPICSSRDETACSACLILPETSCDYFNHDLGRKYLYTISTGSEEELNGFWEM